MIHYGSPLITRANTVIGPVKTGTDSFRVEPHKGTDGTLLWTQNTNYQSLSAQFLPSFSPVRSHDRLYIPAAGGVVLVRENPDQPTGKVFRLVFYGLKNYNADPQTYNANVEINTPITADSEGNIYFGFLVLGSTPISLQSGLARISATEAGLRRVCGGRSANDRSEHVLGARIVIGPEHAVSRREWSERRVWLSRLPQ